MTLPKMVFLPFSRGANGIRKQSEKAVHHIVASRAETSGVNLGSTWGQYGVNMGSSWGQTRRQHGVDVHRRTVEVRQFGVGEEELAVVGVGAAVGHGQDAAVGVLERVADLVGELSAPDALPAAPRARRVAALDHEPRHAGP